MGSGNSRLGSPSSHPPSSSLSPKVKRTKPRKFASLICGCSSSHAAAMEMEDFPDECSVNPSELCSDPLFSEVQKPKEELYSLSSADTAELAVSGNDTADTSVTTEIEGRGNYQQVDSGDFGISNHGNLLFENRSLISPARVTVQSPGDLDRDSSSTTSSTLFDETRSSEVVSVRISSGGIAVFGVDDVVVSSTSEICPENEDVTPQVENIEIQGGESRAIFGASSSTFEVSESSQPLHFTASETSNELIPLRSEYPIISREAGIESEGMADVNGVSVSSSLLPSMAIGSSSWGARRNGRSFWDVPAGHISRAHADIDSPVVFTTTSDSDQTSWERWMFDHSDLFSDDGRDSRYRGSRLQRANERRRHRRFEFWDRLRSGLYEQNWQNASCPLGLHSDSEECSCDRYLTEESSARSSISRIVMLAEALFEVLDEIHRQPIAFALSAGLVTAPESVVESFPLKSYEKSDRDGSEDNIEQCNICFAEYEEGDKIRVLPCHHEYHMECVDKWLKEIHGVCPLCRGDVRDGFTGCATSNPEVTS